MKLFVDDRRNPPDDSWEVCRTITKAIRLLMTQNVQLISLDYDAGYLRANDKLDFSSFAGMHDDAPTVTVPDENFGAIAWVICMMAPDARPHVVLHSGNPAGREEMKRLLWSYSVACEEKPSPVFP